jgi:methyl-accepting chemotaxis protein
MNLRKFFSPAIWIMQQMHFSSKLSLMALALLAPLLAVLIQLLSTQSESIKITRDELQGVALLSQTNTLLRELQHQQSLSDGKLKPSIDALDLSVAALTGTEIQSEWLALKTRLNTTTSGASAASSANTESRGGIHALLIEDVQRFHYSLAKHSSLLFDPDPATYLLIDMVASRTPSWAAHIGQLNTQLSTTASLVAKSVAADARLVAQLDEFDALLRETQFSLALMKDMGPANALASVAVQSSRDYSAQVRAHVALADSNPALQTLSDTGTKAIDRVTDYQNSVVRQIGDRLQQRLSGVKRFFWASILGSTLCVLVVLYFLLAFHFGFSMDLRQMINSVQLIAKGDLCHRVRLAGKDELAEMSTAIDAMTMNFSSMVASVRSNSALVLHAGGSLSQGNLALSERTEQQASNLAQTTASVQELSLTVKDNANASQRSAEMAGSVRDVAETGAQAMTDAIQTVAAIQASTRRMDEIVGVIDGLAFQTNILALNAAVEAARAGESGRGFAVVASEVRSLAQRSAESAKEIRLLIGASSRSVASGVAQIQKAGANLTQVLDGIRDVASTLSQISVSSAEQSNGLSEITIAVNQLDQITHQNSQLAERAVQQAQDLEVRATTLAEVVAAFKLQQGTAEEASDMVARAMVYRRQCGSLAGFVRNVSKTETGFFDRDMYLFVLNHQGTYLAFGGNEAKVGTRVQDIPGIDGDGLIKAISAQAHIEPGWVEYDIIHPSTGRLQSKMSFVQQLDDVIVGCGVYKNLMAP